MYLTKLVGLCDLVAPLVLILFTSISYKLEIHNISILLHNSSIKGLKTYKIQILSAIYLS